MSHRKGGILFSAAANSGTSHEAQNSSGNSNENTAGNGRKLGMMSAMHNEYSDMEEEDDEDEIEENEELEVENPNISINPFVKKSHFTPGNPISSSSRNNETQNSMVSQYGIGAKLLMGMGYQAGKGLGSKQNGIAAPIETKLRPQGLGIGGIREKSAGKTDVSSSEDEKSPTNKTVTFSKPTYDLFAVINTLENAGINVPLYYKELSDNAGTSANPLEVEKAHTKLSAISSQITSLDAKMGNLQLEIGHLDRSLEADILQKSTLEALVEELKLADNDISSTSAVLENIVKEPYANLPDIQTIFVAYAKPHVTTLFTSLNEEALGQLSHWAVLYRNLESEHAPTVLNPWDSLVVQLLKNSPQNPDYDLRFWLDSPVIINSPLVEHYSLEEIVMPSLKSIIEEWDLHQGFETRIIENLADFDWEDSRRREIVDMVAKKYESFFTSEWKELSESLWTYYKHDIRPVLDHFSQTGLLLIDQYHEKRATELKKLLISNLLTFCLGNTSVDTIDKSLALVLEFQHSFNFISSSQSEIVLSLSVLNPMVKIFSQALIEAKGPLSLFYRWQDSFAVLSQEYPGAKDIFLWYTNMMIEATRCFRENIPVAYKLPTYNQNEIPAQALETFVLGEQTTSSVYSIAARDLIVTFKDVVQQKCSQYNVIFQATGRRDEQMNEISELSFPSGKYYECYVSNDVLWVRDGSDFSAVDLLDFLKRHG